MQKIQIIVGETEVYGEVTGEEEKGEESKERRGKERASFSSQYHLIFKVSSTPNLHIDFTSSYPECYTCDDQVVHVNVTGPRVTQDMSLCTGYLDQASFCVETHLNCGWDIPEVGFLVCKDGASKLNIKSFWPSAAWLQLQTLADLTSPS